MRKQEHSLGENKIFVEEFIPDDKQYKNPLVFVHGSFGGYFMWKMITSYLVEQGFECYALSLRGHKPSGEVDLAKVGMNDYVEDIALVINELKLKNPVVIGHSMAGLLVLMYEKKFDKTSAVISIDPSPTLEIQGKTDEEKIKSIPLVYTLMDVGMPTDPEKVMKALPDISQDMLMKMKETLGPESGLARRERKSGISISKESLKSSVLMIGAELGKSVPFGISIESTREMAEYYGTEFFEIKNATHPGVLMGKHAPEVAQIIEKWLSDLKE